MKTKLRDLHEDSAKELIINGVLTRTVKYYDSRQLTVELTPGENGVPAKVTHADNSGSYRPDELWVSWYRLAADDAWIMTVRIEGTRFNKDGKLLKSRGGQQWPIAHGEVIPPDWFHDEWLVNLYFNHMPQIAGFPQKVLSVETA